MDLETLRYELFPFVYGVGGILTYLFRPDSTLLRICGALLFVAGLAILRMRWTYRRALYVQPPMAVMLVRQEASAD